VLLGGLLAYCERLTAANRELSRQNGELQRRSELERRLVASVSHELRTPLNAVIGFSELMDGGRTGPVSDVQREHLGIIRTSGQHMLTLVNDMLDQAQVEAGHIRLAPQPVEPAVVVAECISSLERAAAEQKVSIEFDPRPVGISSLDPTRLRQVVLNYLSNAIKFAGRHATVTVRLIREPGRLLIEVVDTGPGIDAADQPRVFEAFTSLSPAPRDGTGLGLAVTKLIVEAQGGQVGVRSTAGAGSTFFAWLPLAPAGRDDPRPSPIAAAVGRGRKASARRAPRPMVARR
jgi:signal transduction histidine kinase